MRVRLSKAFGLSWSELGTSSLHPARLDWCWNPDLVVLLWHHWVIRLRNQAWNADAMSQMSAAVSLPDNILCL